MKRFLFPLLIASMAILTSWTSSNNEQSAINENAEVKSATLQSSNPPVNIHPYQIKSGYIKYKTNAHGMTMFREVWFDNYGSIQYDENINTMGGQRIVASTLMRDGYIYSWKNKQTTGRKIKIDTKTITNYEAASKADIESFGIKKLGTEVLAGKTCLKMSIEKPVKTVVWTWKGINIKTTTSIVGNNVTTEAVEIKEESIPASRFEVPKNITFQEFKMPGKY